VAHHLLLAAVGLQREVEPIVEIDVIAQTHSPFDSAPFHHVHLLHNALHKGHHLFKLGGTTGSSYHLLLFHFWQFMTLFIKYLICLQVLH